ncbi:hypothetical protein L6R52_18000 [Myxococcota bacterium]|nr:hypothetical protein [Myxococcota bacterium]
MTARALLVSVVLGIAGTLGFVIGVVVDPRAAAHAWMAAWAFVLLIVLGSLLFLLIGHASNARWLIVLRRVSERAATTFPMLLVLALPFILLAKYLYPWAMPHDEVSHHAHLFLQRHPVWLSPAAVVGRALLYFLIWIVTSELLLRWSLAQARAPWVMTTRQRRFATVALWPFALSLTFAGFDWIMGLSPGWGSTAFGLYMFATGMLGGLALLVLLTFLSERGGALRGRLHGSHYYALGRLLLTFTIFWAYIAFTQYLIVYMADLPEEVPFYLVRSKGTWAALSIFLIVGRFVLPFVLLLSKRLKFQPGRLAAVAAWILVGNYLDVLWLVLPALRGAESGPSWVDVAALLSVSGLVATFGIWRARGTDAVPEHDPDLAVSEAYRRT